MLIESRGQLGREGRREESSNPNSIQKDNGFTPLLLSPTSHRDPERYIA
jgi:hypothetical protein